MGRPLTNRPYFVSATLIRMSPNGTGKDRQFERWKPAGTSALFSLSLARIMHKFFTAAPKSSIRRRNIARATIITGKQVA